VAAPVESQFYSVMSESFALEPLPDTRFDQQVDRALFQQARSDALFNIFSAARFDDDGFDSLKME
jgi:hypothetical protein